MTKRSIVYIDGFNLYYGAVKGTAHKWLDLETLFKRLRQDDDIEVIRYFTAEVDGERGLRQVRYLNALATCSLVDVILGRYKYKKISCRVRNCTYTGPRFFRVPEEKRTDVAIGVRLLDDAYQDMADRFVIVSGDSDLVPAVLRLKARFPEKQVIVYVPARNRERGAAVELRTAADRDRTLPMSLIERSQFPAKLPDGKRRMDRETFSMVRRSPLAHVDRGMGQPRAASHGRAAHGKRSDGWEGVREGASGGR